MRNLREFLEDLSGGLVPLYDRLEAESIAYWLVEEYMGKSRSDSYRPVDPGDIPEALYRAVDLLKTGKPIQYIIGKAPFYGRDFIVNEHTLIPRNETEELVHLIIKENPGAGLRLLDIGTGTGCIPITLSLEMHSPIVFALDISEQALEVASKNAALLGATVDFRSCDIIHQLPEPTELDIIVSNPPYIPEMDKSQMHRNVVEFEPGLALFVPNTDPLLFYRVIAGKGLHLLKENGKIYFEVYEKLATEVSDLLRSIGYSAIKIVKDLNGKDRIVTAVKQNR